METQNTLDPLADYLDEEATAVKLNKGVRTLRRWRALRMGPPVTMIGRDPYYRCSGLAEWLRSQEQHFVAA